MYIKKVFIILLVMSQLLWGQYYSVQGIKSSDTLSIRSSPSTDSRKIGELPYNATHIKIEHCKTSKNKNGPKKWCKITYETNSDDLFKGWVAKKYLKRSTPSIYQEQKYIDKKFKVIRHSYGEVLNVRSGMGSNYKIVSELHYNASNIKILSCQKTNKKSKWCWIRHGYTGKNNFGWVFSKYLKSEEKVAIELSSTVNSEKGVYEITSKNANIVNSSNKIIGKAKQGRKIYVARFLGNLASTEIGLINKKYLKPAGQSGHKMIIVDKDEDIDTINILMRGDGEQCEIVRDTTSTLFTSCISPKGAFGDSTATLCTKKRTICKTRNEIFEFVNNSMNFKYKNSDKNIDILNIDVDYYNMSVHNIMLQIKGYGEECSYSIDRNQAYTNCLELDNSESIKMLCTKNKKMCKTIPEIQNAFDDRYYYADKGNSAVRSKLERLSKTLKGRGEDKSNCIDKLADLNDEFWTIQRQVSSDKTNKYNKLLNKVYHVSEKCYNENVYLDDYSSAYGCVLGTDSLKNNIESYNKEPNKPVQEGCADVQISFTRKAELLSYNKKEKTIELSSTLHNPSERSSLPIVGFCKDLESIQRRKECISEQKMVIDKLASCKQNIIRIKLDEEYASVLDIDCSQELKYYDSNKLFEECEKNKPESCYKLGYMSSAKKALMLKKAKKGYKDIDLATNYNQLGSLYAEAGSYSKAIKLLQKALSLRENILGKNHIDTAESYHDMGIYYSATGDYPVALRYLKKALSIRKENLGKEDIDTAKSYQAIGIVYREIGDYTRALKQFQKSLIIYKNVFGENNNEITYVYSHIGNVYNFIGKHKKALEYFEKAEDMSLKLLDDNSLNTAKLYTNLATTYKIVKDYTKANKYFKKSLFIQHTYHKTISSKILNELGKLRIRAKDYRDALNYFRRALAANENLDIQNIDTTYYNMAAVYNTMKEYDKAYELSKKSFDAFIENRDKNFQIQNNKQKELYLKGNINKIKLLLGSAYQYVNSDETNAKTVDQNVFTRWLNYKGSIFDSENMIASLYANTTDKAVKIKIAELLVQKRHLASLYQSLPKPKEKETWKQNIIDTEEKISMLTNKISSKATNFKEQQGLKSISFKDISKEIKENELYIDYASVGEKYYVFSLDHKENIVFDEISEEDRSQIDMLIKTFREDIALILNESNISDEKLKQLTDSSKEKLSKLYELVLNKPLSKELKGKTNLILSPDGALRLLPFEAMFNKQNSQYLVEQKEIRYIPSGKELVRLYKYSDTTKTNKENDNVVIFSNPNFNKKLTKLASINKEEMAITPNTSRAGIIKSLFKMRFNPLPGTKEEAQSIKQTLAGKDKIDEYTEEEASEANLVKINKPKILHIATHGFFINDNTIPNPMLKSGIALSGANTSAIKGKSDGIVTALKLSGLDLKGTDLVVLSACQTGVVDVNSTESVSGLSKAFIQAGAKDIVMSLWSVNDQATKDLMSSFYKEMQIQSSYSKALKEAKLKMIKKDMHPFFWAPFVVNGL